MTKENFCGLMRAYLQIGEAIEAVEQTGVISFYYADGNLNIMNSMDKMLDAIQREMNDVAGLITYCYDMFLNEEKCCFEDTVAVMVIERTFKNWGEVYDFLNSSTYKQNMKEYDELFWG